MRNSNWSNIISQQSSLYITLLSTNHDVSKGKLSLTYSYIQNLNDAILLLKASFPNSKPFQNVQEALIQSNLTQ